MRCIDIDYLISSYVLHRYAATLRVKNCLASFCSNVAVGCNIAVSIRNYVVKRIHYAISCNASACVQFYVCIGGSNIIISIDITFSVSSYIIASLGLTVGRNASACVQFYVCIGRSNIIISIDITFSVSSYIIASLGLTVGRNIAACIQSNVTIVRGEISICCNILRCIDIDYLISSYVLHRYAATLRVKNCLASFCSNVAVGCNIAVSIRNYVVKRIHYAISCNASACVQFYVCIGGSNIIISIDITFSVSSYIIASLGLTVGRNASACIQSNVSIVRDKISVCCNIIRCIDIYCILGSYITDGYNRTLLRINAYIIRCIQISATSRGNVAICLNSNITVMRIIVLRSIDS